MEIINTVVNIFTFFSILYLIYNSVRSSHFRCEVDGNPAHVETDEIKEAYRRTALAEISRQAGRRAELEFVWDRNVLKVTTKGQK